MPDSKGRACHATKLGKADREVARPDHATFAEVTRPDRATFAEVPCGTTRGATCAEVARPARAMWHGRATSALVQPDVIYWGFLRALGGDSFSFS